MVQDALPGGGDVYAPIRNRYQDHYCPKCGTKVLTEEQIQRLKSDDAWNQVLWPISIVMDIGLFLFGWYVGIQNGQSSLGFVLGLVGGGIAFFVGWLFVGQFVSYSSPPSPNNAPEDKGGCWCSRCGRKVGDLSVRRCPYCLN